MIVFDLTCENRHVFEIWFGSTNDYEDQKDRGLIACPYCASEQVEKAVMAPRINGGTGEVVQRDRSPRPAAEPSPEAVKQMLHAMAQAQAKALEKSEYVGMKFVTEARAIHDGEAPERPIHGQATLTDAKALWEEGVPVAPLPFPVFPEGTTN